MTFPEQSNYDEDIEHTSQKLMRNNASYCRSFGTHYSNSVSIATTKASVTKEAQFEIH